MPVTDNSGSFGNVTDAASAASYYPGNTAVNSSEQLYSPIVISKGGSGGTSLVPSFEVPQNKLSANGQFSKNNIAPTRDELDPYFSNILGDSSEWIQQNDFQIAMNNGSGENGADVNLRKVNRSSVSMVSVNHHRGPMILAGWGYDTADRPTPANESNVFEFNHKVVNDRSTWNAGPIDFRWDLARKVWTMGHHMVCGVAGGAISAPVTPCSPTTFSLKIFRNPNADPSAGGSLSNCDLSETVTVYNRDPSLSQEDIPGMVFVIAARINYEYIPVWVGCPEASDEVPPCVC